MAKKDNKFYRYYRSHKAICNWIIVGVLFLLAIGFQFATGVLSKDNMEPFLGTPDKPLFSAQMTPLAWAIVAVLVVCLILGLLFMAQNRTEKAQEEIREERVEAARLRQEVMDERQKQMEDAYNNMKKRRAERQAAKQLDANGAPDATKTESAANEPEEKV